MVPRSRDPAVPTLGHSSSHKYGHEVERKNNFIIVKIVNMVRNIYTCIAGVGVGCRR